MDELEWKLRLDLCEVAKRLYFAGFMTGGDGNLSTILNENEILITPSKVNKGYLRPVEIAKIDRHGHQIAGPLSPTVEVAMHLAAYEERPDICSVAHCHPPILVAFTVAGLSLPSEILPEIQVIFGGEMPVAPYATPGSKNLAMSIRESISKRENNVILLDHHGLLAVGQDIYQSALRVEKAEGAAKVIFYARQLGGEKPLDFCSLGELKKEHEKLMEKEFNNLSGYCHINSCRTHESCDDNQNIDDEEINRIIDEVLRSFEL